MWLKRLLAGQRFAYLIVGLAVLSGLLTFIAFTRWSPITDDPDTIIAVLVIDLVVVLVLTVLIGFRITPLFRQRKTVAGSKLHRRMALFSALIAATPTLFFAAFGGIYFYLGIQTWFNEKVQTAITGSGIVAQNYLEEHQKTLRADALAMSSDLARYLSINGIDDKFNDFFRSQTYVRNISEAILRNERGQTFAQSGLSFSLNFDDLPSTAFDNARSGDAYLYIPENDDRIRVLVSLNTVTPLYLYVGRRIDENVLARVQETQDAANEYNALRKQSARVQKYSLLMFGATGLLLVLAALWFSLNLSRRLMIPLSAIMNAAEKVGHGDYTARVSNFKGFDEFTSLAKTFNTMTEQIAQNITLIESAEKKAAWGEVARRVAHEIKNPLTPIQLSAERLRRKYGDAITKDKEIFDDSIDTIIKHVGDLKRMVDEFSEMANMDKVAVQFSKVDVCDMASALITLQNEAYPDIDIRFISKQKALIFTTDETRLRQALLNLLTNAINSLQEHNVASPKIAIDIVQTDKDVIISVLDNGLGFPDDEAERVKLIEPYVTMRRKGTGLGLAIVAKTAIDLNGTLSLTNGRLINDTVYTGAHANLVFPSNDKSKKA